MASSITMPTARVSASIVIALSVKPMNQIRANVAMIDVGIAIAAMTVERRFTRNSEHHQGGQQRRRATRCSLTLSIDASMNSDEVADDADVVAGRQRRLDLVEPLA